MNRLTYLVKNGWFVLIGAILFSCATTKTGTTERHENIIPFKYKQLEGIILAKDYQILFPGEHTENQFTPTFDEIVLGEKFSKSNIKEINTPLMLNQGGGCPIIYKNIKHYFRQYSGHFNENGDRVLSINSLWDKYTIRDKIRKNTITGQNTRRILFCIGWLQLLLANKYQFDYHEGRKVFSEWCRVKK